MDHIKICTADLDSPRQELFVHGLGFVVLSVFVFGGELICVCVCVYLGRNPAVVDALAASIIDILRSADRISCLSELI